MRFDLESSTGGYEWKLIASKNAAGNSNTDTKYSYIDYTSKELTYYRLVQYDFDGKYEIFGPISAFKNSPAKKVVKYINSLGQEINLEYRGLVFEIYEDGTSRKIIR